MARIVILALFVLQLGLSQSAFALSSGGLGLSTATHNRILTAKEMLKALYPELRGQSLQVLIRDARNLDQERISLDSFNLVLCSPQESQPSFDPKLDKGETLEAHLNCGEEVLLSFFIFANSDLLPVEFRTTYSNNQETAKKLEKNLADHPRWTHEERTGEMKELGVMFGPKDRAKFIEQLPLVNLGKVLGTITLIDAQFWPKPDRGPQDNYVRWAIKFEAKSASGKRMRYSAFANAITGRIFRIVREDSLDGIPSGVR
jgi:hypothetical protein